MINSQDDRVFMRSMATRVQLVDFRPQHTLPRGCLPSRISTMNYETVGTGQEAMPFQKKWDWSI